MSKAIYDQSSDVHVNVSSADENGDSPSVLGIVLGIQDQVIEPVEVLSASKKKLGDIDSKYQSLENDTTVEENVNVINLPILLETLCSSVKYMQYSSVGLQIENAKIYGLCSELKLFCVSLQNFLQVKTPMI